LRINQQIIDLYILGDKLYREMEVMMKAILVGKDKELTWSDVPDPNVGNDEVLIKIHAVALNRADLMQRAGDYPPPVGCPEWMGLEVAGVIVGVGENAKPHRKIGDRVCALLGGGGYAEFVSVHYGMTMPIPEGITDIEAAAIPEAFATAYLNLFIEGQAKAGETLLMNAGASGLASVVIPMAKTFGLRVITTVLTDEIAHSIGHLKVDRVVVTTHEDIVEVMKEEKVAGHGVNLAIDCLGGAIVAKCVPEMERDGRWIMIATLAGDISPIDLKTLYKNAGRIIGNTLRARSLQVKTEILAALVRDVWPHVVSGKVRPTIYKVLPIQEAEKAHAILQRGENIGKVVLEVVPS
jgi:putative PIG3 family NAD(P)H quinone oxidoreductase